MSREATARGAAAGAIAGVVLVYLGLVGMIEKFEIRKLIGSAVTLGKTLLAVPPFVAGYVVVRPRVRRGEIEEVPLGRGAAMGAIAGAVSGAVLTVALAVASAFEPEAIRNIFVAVSPTLLEIVSWGQSIPTAGAILVLGGAAFGAAGAAFRLSPEPVRRPIGVGLVVVLALALLQRIVPTVIYELGFETSWLYSSINGGLTEAGAIILFVISTAAALAWLLRRDAARRRVEALPQEGRRALRGAVLVAIVAILAVLPLLIGSVLSEILGTVGIYALMGLGLNIVVGYAGLLDLGYVAFFAVGAYFTALLTGALIVTSLGDQAPPAFTLDLSFYAALPLVIAIAAFVGVLIGAPVLRLRGDYLAIVTLGFGEIARVLVTSDAMKAYVGGAQGLRDIPAAPIGGIGFRDPQNFYWLVLVFCILAIYVSRRLADSRIGRAWSAMREDEQVAEAMGISTVKYKLLAFAIGAAVGCVSGALFAVKIGSLSPASFEIFVSITALAVIILGGIGSIPGVVVGAAVLIGLPGLLSEFEEYRLLMYGAVLVAIMILRPQGLIPNVRRSRELHEEERSQDAWLKRAGDASTDATVAVGTAARAAE